MKTGIKRGRIARRLGALLLAAALMAGTLTVLAAAAEPSTVTVELRPNVTIVVDGAERTFFNAKGQEVHPIYYSGTHYIPVRATGELMGKNVNWDNSTLTISLSGTRTSPPVQGTPDTAATVRNISAQIRPDFSIVVDGVKRGFTDAKGNAVYPMLYEGTNYLPVRAIGELMGKTVSWDSKTLTITLSAPNGGSLVTDADSFGQTASQTVPPASAAAQTGGIITAEEAKAKALAHAGLTAAQVTFVQARLEWDDGRQVYDVEFYDASYSEYDYEIDAVSGAVISFDYDAENFAPPSNAGSSGSGSYIGAAKAKSIALSNAGFTASQVTRLRCELDYDDGRWEYQVEFYQGTMEYEYEIDAVSGKILSRDVESIYD